MKRFPTGAKVGSVSASAKRTATRVTVQGEAVREGARRPLEGRRASCRSCAATGRCRASQKTLTFTARRGVSKRARRPRSGSRPAAAPSAAGWSRRCWSRARRSARRSGRGAGPRPAPRRLASRQRTARPSTRHSTMIGLGLDHLELGRRRRRRDVGRRSAPRSRRRGRAAPRSRRRRRPTSATGRPLPATTMSAAWPRSTQAPRFTATAISVPGDETRDGVVGSAVVDQQPRATGEQRELPAAVFRAGHQHVDPPATRCESRTCRRGRPRARSASRRSGSRSTRRAWTRPAAAGARRRTASSRRPSRCAARARPRTGTTGCAGVGGRPSRPSVPAQRRSSRTMISPASRRSWAPVIRPVPAVHRGRVEHEVADRADAVEEARRQVEREPARVLDRRQVATHRAAVLVERARPVPAVGPGAGRESAVELGDRALGQPFGAVEREAGHEQRVGGLGVARADRSAPARRARLRGGRCHPRSAPPRPASGRGTRASRRASATTAGCSRSAPRAPSGGGRARPRAAAVTVAIQASR